MNTKMKTLLSPVPWILIALTALLTPSRAQGTPIKELAKKWNRIAADGTVQDILKIQSATTDKAKNLAHDMAEAMIAEAKLQRTVHSKWGQDAEQKIAAVIGSDTAKDDDEAEETINEDHAVLKFKNESIAPLFLVKSGGDWKIDCDAYVTGLGEHLAEGQKAMRAITAIIQDALKEIASGAVPDADALAGSLKKKIEAVDDGK